MAIDLQKMSRKELEEHRVQVDKAIQSAVKRERVEARKAAEKAAAEFGFSLDELSDNKQRRGKGTDAARKSKAPARYFNPADRSQTWTGKGRQPNWFKQAVAAGTDPDKMAL